MKKTEKSSQSKKKKKLALSKTKDITTFITGYEPKNRTHIKEIVV
jgi:hypothetical protein